MEKWYNNQIKGSLSRKASAAKKANRNGWKQSRNALALGARVPEHEEMAG
jgi:hypothetical protein